jgi:hypothetical protein
MMQLDIKQMRKTTIKMGLLSLGIAFQGCVQYTDPYYEPYYSDSSFSDYFSEDNKENKYREMTLIYDQDGKLIGLGKIDDDGAVNILISLDKEKEQELVDIGEKEKVDFYPKGVNIQCIGYEPFTYKKYAPDTYLTNILVPRTIRVLLSFENVDELEVIGQSESALEAALEDSQLTYVISRIDQTENGEVLTPVKSFNITNPMPSNIQKIDYSAFAFETMLNPIFLDGVTFTPGKYAITDVWLSYKSGNHRSRKVSGSCPVDCWEVASENHPPSLSLGPEIPPPQSLQILNFMELLSA